jgi:hypothetical protein
MITRLSLLLACMLSASCALNNTMLVQDAANTGLRAPEDAQPLVVTRDLRLSVSSPKLRHAAVDAGSYDPVATSDAGTFYIAPYDAFAIGSGGATETRVGGLLRRRDGSLQIWCMIDAVTPKHWNIAKSGIWIRTAKQGFNHITSRPWVEPDFAVPQDAIHL